MSWIKIERGVFALETVNPTQVVSTSELEASIAAYQGQIDDLMTRIGNLESAITGEQNEDIKQGLVLQVHELDMQCGNYSRIKVQQEALKTELEAL